ncbi:MAG TPA: hypothetical protein VHJ20_04710 [Polyangia bacterium]|nr:hypothetical protein [Polyangia bacterium]
MKRTATVVAAAATLLALMSSFPSVARAERPRMAVMELSAPKVAADLRQRMTRSVQEGLLASGADVVEGIPAAATGPGGAPCDGSGCITAVAKAAVAAYVVRGTLEIEGRTYGLRLEILDGRSGDLIESREDRCEICTEGEALEMAGVSASALKVQAFKKTPVAPPPAPSEVVAPAAPMPPPAAVEASPARDHHKLGWIGVGAGAVAIGVGSALIGIDGHGTCGAASGMQCPDVYQTKAGGITLLALGVAAVAAGAFVLTGKF